MLFNQSYRMYSFCHSGTMELMMSSFMVVKIKTQLTKLQDRCLRCRGSQSLDLE